MIMKELLFRLKWRMVRPRALAAYKRLSESPRPSEQALQCIVRHAMEHTRFYAAFYKAAGFHVDDIGSDGWFERLPVVTKAELRAHFEDMTDQNQKQFRKRSTTGGSTGEPTKTGYDRRIPEEIYSWRLQERWGVHPWDDHAYVWRDTRKSFKAKLMNALMWWPTRHLKLDATFMTPQGIEKFMRRCAVVRPKLLQGYVGAITQVAEWVADGHREVLKGWSPKVVWTTSAPLPPAQRRLIESTFDAPVCNEYGSCECRWLASQVPGHPGLKVNTEHVFIEFVGEDNRAVKTGEYGRTLITNLEDTVFPLIRYENGDRGRWLEYPFIDEVKGRESESFVLPSGMVINGEYLTTIFDAQPELVHGFRVVQHKDLSITVECVPSASEMCAKIEAIVSDFGKRLGGEVSVECKFVDSIPHDRGKLRFVVRER